MALAVVAVMVIVLRIVKPVEEFVEVVLGWLWACSGGWFWVVLGGCAWFWGSSGWFWGDSMVILGCYCGGSGWF